MKAKLIYSKILLLLILQYPANAQFTGVALPDETEDILQVLSSEEILDKAVFAFAGRITSYQFDGDYSLNRIYPDRPQNTISLICTSPMAFQTSIHSVLKNLDGNYDSSFYQNELKEARFAIWNDQSFNLPEGHKFTRSTWRGYRFSKTGCLSQPLLTKSMTWQQSLTIPKNVMA